MLVLTHYNDGKENDQSHEVSIKDPIFYYNPKYDVSSLNPFSLYGYGRTKEEAIENFKTKFDYVLREWEAFGKMLFETSYIEDNMIEVNCIGDEIIIPDASPN